MEFNTDPDLIAKIRELRKSGKLTADILHLLNEHNVLPTVGYMFYLCEAFNLDFGDVTPVGGWKPDGTGELNDEAINALIDISGSLDKDT